MAIQMLPMLAMSAASGIGSYFGSQRNKQDDPEPLYNPQQLQAQSNLLSGAMPSATTYLQRAGQPYSGEMLTGYEKTGLKTLGDYLSSPPPTENPAFQGAMGELEKTFAGEYDPVSSTYYQAYRSAVMRELEEAKDRVAREHSASDKYFGGGTIKEESELEEGAMNSLAVTLGQMFENERNRRLEAVPLAQSLTGAGEQLTQGRVLGSQTLGSLPFNREYGEYVRQMQELGVPLQTALSIATMSGQYYQPGYEPSGWESFGAPAMGALAMYLGSQNSGGQVASGPGSTWLRTNPG